MVTNEAVETDCSLALNTRANRTDTGNARQGIGHPAQLPRPSPRGTGKLDQSSPPARKRARKASLNAGVPTIARLTV